MHNVVDRASDLSLRAGLDVFVGECIDVSTGESGRDGDVVLGSALRKDSGDLRFDGP